MIQICKAFFLLKLAITAADAVAFLCLFDDLENAYVFVD